MRIESISRPIPARAAASALLLAAVLCAPSAHALTVEPGLWRIDIRTENAFTGAQQMQQEQCIEESEFDPEMLRRDMGECDDLEFDEGEEEMSWTFRCGAEGVQGEGEGRVRISGGELEGGMRLVMSMAAMGGREFVIESTWRGRRVGACR